MKKILTLLLFIAAVMTGWAQTTTVGGFTYSLYTDEYINTTGPLHYYAKLTAIDDNVTGVDVTIPDVVAYNGKNYAVKNVAISTANANVKSITLGNYVMNISALTTLPALEKVTFVPQTGDYPDEVYVVSAFQNCTNLKEVTMYKVKAVPRFTGCTNLETVILNDATEFGNTSTFKSLTKLKTVDLSNITFIRDYTFSGCTSLTDIDLSKVTSIRPEAFKGCTSLNNINLSNVETLWNNAFEGCTSLEEVDLSKVTTFEGYVNDGSDNSYAFKDCTGLKKVTLSKDLESLSKRVFSGCEALTTVVFPADSKLETIKENAFENCTSLANIDFPNSVTEIKQYAFQNCGFSEVALPSSLQIIHNSAFKNCSNLSNTIFTSLPEIDGFNQIGGDCFQLNLNDNSYISSGSSNYPNSFASTSYKRTMGNQWGTLCLPFAITVDDEKPYDFYTISNIDSETGALNLTKITTSSIAAGTPVIVRRNSAVTGIELQETNVAASTLVITPRTSTNLTGNFASTTITSGYYIANDHFWNAADVTDGVSVKAFRAWIPASAISSSSNKALSINVSDDVLTDVLQLLNNDNGQNRYYDLNGRETNELQQGVNIVKTADGKTRKVIIK